MSLVWSFVFHRWQATGYEDDYRFGHQGFYDLKTWPCPTSRADVRSSGGGIPYRTATIRPALVSVSNPLSKLDGSARDSHVPIVVIVTLGISLLTIVACCLVLALCRGAYEGRTLPLHAISIWLAGVQKKLREHLYSGKSGTDQH